MQSLLFKQRLRLLTLLTLLLSGLFSLSVQAQTVLVSSTGDGGFNNGATFAANGWTVTNSANNPWVVGTAVTAAPFAGNSAYISNNGGTSNAYTVNATSVNYFYRDIVIPAGQPYIQYSFNWLGTGETNYDAIQFFTAPTTVNPVSTTTYPLPTNNITTTNLVGATFIGGYSAQSTPQTATGIFLATPGTTLRIIFGWKNDGTLGTQPSGSIDNISFTALAAPPSFTANAIGGLWNTPSTWVGGVVPSAGSNVTIPAGAIVTVDRVVACNDLNIDGTLQWNATANAMTASGNITIASTGRFLPYTTAAGGTTGVTINVGGDLINNGYANFAVGTTTAQLLNFNGSQQNSSLAQTLGGTGVFEGDGTRGIIRQLFFQTTGSSTINTTQNLTTYSLGNTGGPLNTNGKLKIDNTAAVYGLPFNTQVASVAVTAMGTNYSVAPVVFGAGVTQYANGLAATVNTRYVSGNNVYLCTAAGTFNTTAPTTTGPGTFTTSGPTLLWIGTTGTLGNPFQVTAVTVGTQYFYGGNLYTCTVAGIPSAAAPPVHTAGIAVSGAATFLYVGTPAQVSVNYDAATLTVRSLNIVNPGSGYSSATAPAITFNLGVAGGTGSGAAATAVVLYNLIGPVNSVTQKSGVGVISGGLTINNDQGTSLLSTDPQASSGVGFVATTNGGVGYSVPPVVGFAGPTALNLITNAGSGYTAVPTINVTGGNLVSGTALTSANFTITVNQGQVVSVYLNAGTTACYSTPPTLSFSTGNATLAFPAGSWPTATANIGTNSQLTSFTVTNTGFGYVAAPTVGVGTTSGTPNGGKFITVATTPVSRLGMYSLTLNFFNPAPSAVAATEDNSIPANRKLNNLSLNGNGAGLNVTNNLILYGSAPFALNASGNALGNVLDLGGNNLLCTWNGYAGATSTFGATNTYIKNGSMTLTGRGGASIFNYPFSGTFTWFAGNTPTANTTGSTATTVKVTETGAPSNAIAGTGSAVGNRAYRVQLNAGAITGTAPTVTLGFNSQDGLTATQDVLYVADANALSGAWTIRSTAYGAGGALPATGVKATATATPGPIVITGDNYYAFATPPACTTPVPGNTVAGTNPVCTGQTSLLTLQNALVGSGYTYQWQSSTTGTVGSFTDVVGANAASYTATVTANIYYQCVVTCATGATTGTSTPVQLTLTTACYCTPTYANGTGSGDYISRVTVNTLNNLTGASPTPFYTLFPQTGTTTTSLTTGVPYTMTVAGGTWGTCYISVWIDYNQDGTFQTTEFVGVSPNVGALANGNLTLTVPGTALAGATRMRLRSSDTAPGASNAQSCGAANSSFGETEDYVVTIQAAPAAPANPTNITATPTCTGGATLTATGTPPAGIVWYWQGTNATGTDNSTGANATNPLTVFNNGTYYIRAYDPVSGLWSGTSGSIVVSNIPTNAATAPAIVSSNGTAACVTTNISVPTATASDYWQTSALGVSTASPATVPFNGVTANTTYYVRSLDVSGCWSAASTLAVTVLPTITATTAATQIAACGTTGLVTINISNPTNLAYFNNFSTSNLGAATIYGNASVLPSGVLQLTPNLLSQGGAIVITDPNAVNSNAMRIEFDLITVGPLGADGLSYSFGDDVTLGVPVAPAAESGSGTKFKLSFDAINNSPNTAGIYLMYNCTVTNQAPPPTASPGVLGYVSNLTWTGGVTRRVIIDIDNAGLATVSLDGVVIFNNVALGAGYTSANKATWRHAFAARTGGLSQGHQIDNLVIAYNNTYQYSFDNGATWGSSNNLVAPAGTYTTQVRYIANNACAFPAGSATITPFTLTAGTASAVSTGICTGTTASLSVTGVTGSIQWQSSTTSGSGFTDIVGATNANYTSGALTTTTYYRVSSNCGGAPVFSNEVAVTVYGAATVSPASVAICAGTTTTLTATSGGTYQWNALGGSATTGSVSASAAGTYSVVVTRGTCVNTATAVVSNLSNPTVTATATPLVQCEGGSLTLTSTAATTQAGYALAAIPYAVNPTAGATVLASAGVNNFAPGNTTYPFNAPTLDDGVWSGIPLGFSFNYFGTNYSTINVGVNGVLQFGTNNSTIFTGQAIPLAANPNEYIGCPMMDVDARTTGTIQFLTTGTAPNRKFIIDWNVPVFNSTDTYISQAVLNESTNSIEVHFKQFGNTSTKIYTIGIENAAGSVGTPAPGRVATTTATTADEAWRFFPNTITSYAWSATNAYTASVQNPAVITPTVPANSGTYTLTVTDGNGCSATSSQVVTVNAAPVATITGTTTACGTVTLTAAGGTTYAWSGGDAPTSAVNTFTTSGTYTVTVTNAAGCTATASQTIVVNPNPVVVISGTPTACASVVLTASGGTTYAWSGGATPSTDVNTFATSGTYTVTVTSAAGCTSTASQAVIVNSNPTATVTGSPTGCGIVSLTASGGASYAWSGGDSPTTAANTFTTSGTYTLTVTVAAGCSATATQVVVVNPVATASITGTSTACGTVTLTAAGGTTYNWSGGATPTAAVNNFTTSGTYNVTVTDANSCTASATQAVTVNTIPTVTITGTSTACGSVTLTATGGGTYAWSGGATPTTAVNTFTTSGTYVVTVTSAAGCTATASRVVTVNAIPSSVISANPNPICRTATLSLSVPSAGAGTTYNWSGNGIVNANNSATTAVPGATGASPYNVTVTSSAGCTATGTVSVTVNALPSAALSASPGTVCRNSTVNLSVPTAGAGASYVWAGNGINNTSTNATTAVPATAGIQPYTVTVTNANGCTASAQTNVTVNALPTVAITGTTAVCAGLTTTLSPTTAGTWTSSNPAVATVTNAGVVTGVTAGTVTFTFTQTTTGCASAPTPTVTVNALPVVSITGASAICVADTTTLSPTTGGIWISSAASVAIVTNAGIVTGITAGSATFRFTQTSTGCLSVPTAAVTVNPLPNASIIPSATVVCQNTVVNLSVLSGGAGSTYNWTGTGVVNNNTNTQTVTLANAGSEVYNVTITNGNNCSATGTTTITVNALPTPTLTANGNPICQFSTVGLFVTNAGANATYDWAGNGVGNNNSNSTTATPTVAGTQAYNVTVTNAAGCTASATTSILVNAVPSAVITTNPVAICQNETLTLSVPNAGGGASYLWTGNGIVNVSNDTTTAVPTITGVQAYNVTVTDNNSCVSTGTINVTVNILPDATLTAAPNAPCVGAVISYSVPSAGPSATYNWSGLDIINSNISNTFGMANTSGLHIYNVTVTTANGCTSTGVTSVLVNALPTASLTANSTSLCANQTVNLTTTVASAGSTYTWSGDGVNNTNTNTTTAAPTFVGTHVYNVTVTTAAGCTATATTSVTTNDSPVPTLTAVNNSICQGNVLTLNVSSSGILSSYNWSGNGIVNSNANGTIANPAGVGTFPYAVTVTDINGCTASVSTNVTVNAVTVPVITQSGNTLSTTGTGTFQWFLNGATINGATSATYTPTQSGMYTVVTVDANGCGAASSSFEYNPVGVEQVNTKDLILYPNPTTGMIYFSQFHLMNIEVFAVDGRLVQTATNVSQLDMSGLVSGAYFVRCNIDNEIVTFRVVKD